MKKLRIISAIVTILIMILIFGFSSQNREESATVSRGLTQYIADIISYILKLTENQKLDLISNIHGLIRKIAHFIIYTSLGISSTAFFISYLYKKRKSITLITSVGFCCFYAITDEIHQIFVDGRAFQLSDLAVDLGGVVLGTIVFTMLISLINKIINKRKAVK